MSSSNLPIVTRQTRGSQVEMKEYSVGRSGFHIRLVNTDSETLYFSHVY